MRVLIVSISSVGLAAAEVVADAEVVATADDLDAATDATTAETGTRPVVAEIVD